MITLVAFGLGWIALCVATVIAFAPATRPAVRNGAVLTVCGLLIAGLVAFFTIPMGQDGWIMFLLALFLWVFVCAPAVLRSVIWGVATGTIEGSQRRDKGGSAPP